jgi:transcriptional regulator with XRE-family HTH domain
MAHWTERSTEDFLYRITADLIDQLEQQIQSKSLSKAELAKKLGVTKGRVSQILNNADNNLSIRTIIRFARALGIKIAIVAYDDKDRDNKRGPINSEIFRICWENSGKPADFWSLEEAKCTAITTETLPHLLEIQITRVFVVHTDQHLPVTTWDYWAREERAVTIDLDMGQKAKLKYWQLDSINKLESEATTQTSYLGNSGILQ